MLIFTATQAGAQSTHYLRAANLRLAAMLLLVTTFSYGQPIGPAGARPEAAAAAMGPPPPPSDDGIPQPLGGLSDDLDAPREMKRPTLSDKAPQPAADLRNFEGVWYHVGRTPERLLRDLYGARLAYTEEGRKILKHRREMANAGKPLTNAGSQCYPAPIFNFRIDAPFEIVQTHDLIYFVFQEFHAVWQIDMKWRNSPAGERTFGGHSVGHWDGNTLVVDTDNFKEPLWLDSAGTPASKDVRLTYRIRKLEAGMSLEIITTVNDPQMYARPWSFASSFAWGPNLWMLGEYNCELQVGAPGGAESVYGLTEDEPAPQ